MKTAPSTAWKKGQSGNPAGKPKGTKNRATLLALAAMEGELDAIVKSIISAAKSGDMTAARLVVDKLIPVAKDRPMEITLPDMTDIQGCLDAQTTIINAVSAGELLSGEGECLTGMIDSKRKSYETLALEDRLKAIEGRLGIAQ
jgi:hypothetical protein